MAGGQGAVPVSPAGRGAAGGRVAQRNIRSDAAGLVRIPLDRTGPYAKALAFAEAYEMGMFETATELATEMGIPVEKLPEMYNTALAWTAEALSAMAAPVPAANERKLATR